MPNEATPQVVATPSFVCYGRLVSWSRTFLPTNTRIHEAAEPAVALVYAQGEVEILCPRCGRYPAEAVNPANVLGQARVTRLLEQGYATLVRWPGHVNPLQLRQVTVREVVLGHVGDRWAYLLRGTATRPGGLFSGDEQLTWWTVLDARTGARLEVDDVGLPDPGPKPPSAARPASP